MTLRQNGQDYIVNTSGMETVEDLINGIEASGARVQAALDSTGKYFSIQSTESGTTLSIGETAGGGNLATRLGVRTLDNSTPVSRLNFVKASLATTLDRICASVARMGPS